MNIMHAVRRHVRTSLGAAALLACLLPSPPAEATIAPQLQLDDADRAELAQVEDYLNGITTLQAAFEQRSSTGESARGEIYVSRPGKLRLEYQPPVPILVVANGSFLIYYDRSLEQVSYIPLGSTPASVLLDKQISLASDGLTVIGLARDAGTLRLTIVRSDNPGEGSITLVFDEQPLALTQWQVTDAQGIITTVSLIGPTFGVKLNQKLFDFTDPRQPSRESP